VSLRAQTLHFIAGRLARCITRQPLLARLQEVIRPAIMQVAELMAENRLLKKSVLGDGESDI
jgi:hypothetical protein